MSETEASIFKAAALGLARVCIHNPEAKNPECGLCFAITPALSSSTRVITHFSVTMGKIRFELYGVPMEIEASSDMVSNGPERIGAFHRWLNEGDTTSDEPDWDDILRKQP